MTMTKCSERTRPTALLQCPPRRSPTARLVCAVLACAALAGCASPTQGPNVSSVGMPGSEAPGMTTFDEEIAAGAAPANSSSLPVNVGSGRTLPVYGPPVLFGYEGGRLGP